MSIKGFNIYEYYINKFINKCSPEGKFKLIFLAISPPISRMNRKSKDNKLCVHKYFYNPYCRDQLRDYVFARVFLRKSLGRDTQQKDFLCKLTKCGVILLDLVYFPTNQEIISELISQESGDANTIRRAIVAYTVNNIKQLVSTEAYIIILYNKHDKTEELVKTIDEIKRRIAEHVKHVKRVLEISDFFPRNKRYNKEHVRKIQKKIIEEIGPKVYEEITKCLRELHGRVFL